MPHHPQAQLRPPLPSQSLSMGLQLSNFVHRIVVIIIIINNNNTNNTTNNTLIVIVASLDQTKTYLRYDNPQQCYLPCKYTISRAHNVQPQSIVTFVLIGLVLSDCRKMSFGQSFTSNHTYFHTRTITAAATTINQNQGCSHMER